MRKIAILCALSCGFFFSSSQAMIMERKRCFSYVDAYFMKNIVKHGGVSIRPMTNGSLEQKLDSDKIFVAVPVHEHVYKNEKRDVIHVSLTYALKNFCVRKRELERIKAYIKYLKELKNLEAKNGKLENKQIERLDKLRIYLNRGCPLNAQGWLHALYRYQSAIDSFLDAALFLRKFQTEPLKNSNGKKFSAFKGYNFTRAMVSLSGGSMTVRPGHFSKEGLKGAIEEKDRVAIEIKKLEDNHYPDGSLFFLEM